MKYPESNIKLNKTGRKFRRDVLKEYQIEDAHDLRRLELASYCLDRVEECQQLIEKDGAFIKDRFEQLKEHPACKVERDNKTLFARLIRELGLDLEQPETPRPPRLYN